MYWLYDRQHQVATTNCMPSLEHFLHIQLPYTDFISLYCMRYAMYYTHSLRVL